MTNRYAETRLVLAPDQPAGARGGARGAGALEEGVPLHEIAVFHGADREYRRLLRDAFAPAAVPSPIAGCRSADPAGRGVLLMLVLPEEDYRRTTLLDFMSIAPLKDWLPGSGAGLNMSTVWDRFAKAGVTPRRTCGVNAWTPGWRILRRGFAGPKRKNAPIGRAP
jgi:hypothetical protein